MIFWKLEMINYLNKAHEDISSASLDEKVLVSLYLILKLIGELWYNQDI